jgi:hypothetical protein
MHHSSSNAFHRAPVRALILSIAITIAACGGHGEMSSIIHPLAGSMPMQASGSLDAAMTAHTMSERPAQALRQPLMARTWSRIGLLQPFDYGISRSEARDIAPKFDLAWGSGDPSPWHAGNPKIDVSYYLPFDTDADLDGFGSLGHPLSWWLSSKGHPDWVLYRCDRTTPAWVSGLPTNTPLDISNPAVVAYQMRLVVPYMKANGFNALAADVVSLHDGSGGCGVWTDNHTVWVQKFSGQHDDPNWAAAVQSWAAYAQQYLHAQSDQMALLANSDVGYAPIGDRPSEELVGHVDAVQDEGGFTSWGGQIADDHMFREKEWWMDYVQGVGKPYLIADLWKDQEPDASQREYAIATYLMGRGEYAALFTAKYGEYGVEHYYPEYADAVGSGCEAMQHTQGVYMRRLANALVIVNTAGSTMRVTLPKKAEWYRDMEGKEVTNPMPIDGESGLVLLTSSGCG